MQASPSGALASNTKRPLAISGVAAVLVFFGSIIALAGLLAFVLPFSTRVDFHPFYHAISISLSHWEVGILLLAIGGWWLWTGRALWNLRPIALASAWSISALLFVRGLLILAPPIDADDVKLVAYLIAPAIVGMALLWRSSPAFRPK
jgi:hypothetical protein